MKFAFRLEKVLDFRRMVEEWAKSAYLDARAKVLEAEALLSGLNQERDRLMDLTPLTVEDCQALDLRLTILEQDMSHQRTIIDVLVVEERAALREWTERRAEVKALEELREKAYAAWIRAMDRKEQAALDEWSVQRRAA